MTQHKTSDIKKNVVTEMSNCLQIAEIIRDWSVIEINYSEELNELKNKLEKLPLRIE